jgi:phosphoglycerate kinase
MDMKNLADASLKGKRVLLRVDFNVPMDENNNIKDDKRIKETMPTIQYLMKKGAKTIIITHVGRPKEGSEENVKTETLAAKLAELLGKEVQKVNDYQGADVENAINQMKEGDVLMMENIRLFPGEKSKKEEERTEFAKQLAKLGDVYVNDAFANCHRDHASMTGIPKFLPSYAGLLVEAEVKTISAALEKPEKPFVSIIGGAKADKLNAIKNLLPKADRILLGGALAFLFLKQKGMNVGSTKVDTEGLDATKELFGEIAKSKKIILPVDAVVADRFDSNAKVKKVAVDSIPEGWMALDLGPKTIELYKKELEKAKTIIWNGPLGVFEMKKFEKGTKEIAKFIAGLNATTIVGGGDSAAAVEQFKLASKMTHVSTGGGASLNLFEGKKLVAIEALRENAKKFR